MEVLGFDVPAWILYSVAISFTLYLYFVYINRKLDYLGLPGPSVYPVVGCGWLSLFTKGFVERQLAWYKKYGHFYRFVEMGSLCIAVSDPTVLRDVLVKEANNFRNRRSFGKKLNDKFLDNVLTVLRDDHWKHVRAELTPTFSSGKLRKMCPLISASVQIFLKNLKKFADEEKEFECKGVFSAFSLDIILSTAFGVITDTQENPDDPIIEQAKSLTGRASKTRLLRILFFNSVALFTFAAGLQGSADMAQVCARNSGVGGHDTLALVLFPSLAIKLGISISNQAATEYFSRLVDQIIEERNKEKGDHNDFLQLVLKANEEHLSRKDPNELKGLTLDEVKSQCIVFFIAGFENNASTLQYCTYFLCLEPEWQQKLIDEVDRELNGAEPDYDNTIKLQYMEMFIAETLRMYPLAPRLERECAENITLGGQFFPKGSIVNIPVYGIHHDPEFYPDPEKFDPERFSPENKANHNPYVYLPFGVGPRNCIGMRLAQLQVRMLLAAILQKFRFVRCEKTEVPLVMDKMKPMSPANGVWAKVQPRE